MKPLNPPTPTDDVSSSSKRKLSWPLLALLGFLLILLLFKGIPGYFSWSWPWMSAPKVSAIKPLKEIRNEGLALPGWEITEQQVIPLGGNKWSYQQLRGDWEKPIIIFLLSQNSSTNQPRVEWVDFNGFQHQFFDRWKTDSYRNKTWQVRNPDDPSQTLTVRSRFLRGWNSAQTYAIVQWYAWPTGGSAAPVDWFIADRKAQIAGDRAPWMAVSIMIPIEPLGDIEAEAEDIAGSLVALVQTTLMETAFQD
ncbi:cyanoexosortase B system-associated protein [Roseofilum casamattae]|uniref:Cyanoexosortase B system-associated protein n=1 Tax=Roseofilum casamattae BLCC-M143 TaxID=3022442 RepID=A0ABT7BYW9_9CYAN|nr:cyanoexosortase B system-associated protein [Roseofilum casamattae]MDJ1184392.1 cyanoexosortase B system-associated protein [Roseofilum casamattae BLCC-M143]